jgi:hypothetical protein
VKEIDTSLASSMESGEKLQPLLTVVTTTDLSNALNVITVNVIMQGRIKVPVDPWHFSLISGAKIF